jgi:hypothetical protein
MRAGRVVVAVMMLSDDTLRLLRFVALESGLELTQSCLHAMACKVLELARVGMRHIWVITVCPLCHAVLYPLFLLGVFDFGPVVFLLQLACPGEG